MVTFDTLCTKLESKETHETRKALEVKKVKETIEQMVTLDPMGILKAHSFHVSSDGKISHIALKDLKLPNSDFHAFIAAFLLLPGSLIVDFHPGVNLHELSIVKLNLMFTAIESHRSCHEIDFEAVNFSLFNRESFSRISQLMKKLKFQRLNIWAQFSGISSENAFLFAHSLANSRIEALDLSIDFKEMSEQEMLYLGGGIAFNKTIKTLRLRSERFECSDINIKLFFVALSKNTSINHIEIGSLFSLYCLQDLVYANLVFLIKENKNLTSLGLFCPIEFNGEDEDYEYIKSNNPEKYNARINILAKALSGTKITDIMLNYLGKDPADYLNLPITIKTVLHENRKAEEAAINAECSKVLAFSQPLINIVAGYAGNVFNESQIKKEPKAFLDDPFQDLFESFDDTLKAIFKDDPDLGFKPLMKFV